MPTHKNLLLIGGSGFVSGALARASLQAGLAGVGFEPTTRGS